MQILIRKIIFSLKKDNRTREHEVTLVKGLCIVDIRKYSFSQRTINGWNKLFIDYVIGSILNIFKDNVVHISQEGGLHIY